MNPNIKLSFPEIKQRLHAYLKTSDLNPKSITTTEMIVANVFIDVEEEKTPTAVEQVVNNPGLSAYDIAQSIKSIAWEYNEEVKGLTNTFKNKFGHNLLFHISEFTREHFMLIKDDYSNQFTRKPEITWQERKGNVRDIAVLFASFLLQLNFSFEYVIQSTEYNQWYCFLEVDQRGGKVILNPDLNIPFNVLWHDHLNTQPMGEFRLLPQQ